MTADAVRATLERMPYARFLGLRVEMAGDEMTAILPFAEHIVGNPVLPAIHGGVLGALMEITAITQLSIAGGEGGSGLLRQPKPVDVTIEYLRSARPLTTYARAQVRRLGRRIANVHVEAWQEQRANPVAALRGHFLLTPRES